MEKNVLTNEQLQNAIAKETKKFHDYYIWLEQSMPAQFFEEVSNENIILIIHSLMGFPLQDFFSTINLKHAAIVMCLDSSGADLRVLKDYDFYGIKNYETYISTTPVPFPKVSSNLRISTIYFTEAIEIIETPFPLESKEQLRALVRQRNREVTNDEFEKLISSINNRFLRAMPLDRLILVLDMFFRAKTRDNCQYEVRYNQDWEETNSASMHIVLAWRNSPKNNFLFRIARVINRHKLIMKRVNAAYIEPYGKNNILLMSLSLHGADGKAVWDIADIPRFLRELLTVKYFASFDLIDQKIITPGYAKGVMGNLIRSMVNFIHQSLVYIDEHLYTLDRIEEDLCSHPELTKNLCEAFRFKFNPDYKNYEKYETVKNKYLKDVSQLDTGHEENDTRRRNVLLTAMRFVEYTVKTNFYRLNYTALSFRLDPTYLDHIPINRHEIFPEIPFGIFYIKGMHFFGFHIRFKDLSRGGIRTVVPPNLTEHIVTARNFVFRECYNLAYTQQKKNKDIPEGGAKGVIYCMPYDRIESEAVVLQNELRGSGIKQEEIDEAIYKFKKDQKWEFMYQAQRSYIESLLTIINCDPDGKLRAKYIVDYWNRPEYLYLGPDENMHDHMIDWIANFSVKYDYRPGSAFISGQPDLGINHKEYGVTSLGVNVYMSEALKYLGIDPEKDTFTVKISGGPDGDVAGNQILNLKKYYPNTAKLLAITDVSGTIYDPEGLNLEILSGFFKNTKPIKHYPPEELNEGGFLLDRTVKRVESDLAQKTLCYRKKEGTLVEDWLSGSDMNRMFRQNLNQVHTDVFIPAGGRPRTLNESNVQDFLDETGKPTSKAIIEGANLYLSEEARKFLEDRGVLVIKDSSANKTGVICSSFEILSALTMSDEEFMKKKPILVEEILDRLRICAKNEAELLLKRHQETHEPLTTISDQISERINQFTYQILDYLEDQPLNKENLDDPLIKTFLNYCLTELTEKYRDDLLTNVPDLHIKAIIACHIGAQLVYNKGLSWEPSVVDILNVILKGPELSL